MASLITKKVVKHVLKDGAEKKFGSDDPYFEYVAPVDKHGNAVGKPKKQRRAIPPGLNKKEEKILKKVTRRAYRLDNCINICGVRLGWSTIIGIVPALGDVVDVLMALMVFWTCTQAELPAALRSRMMLNILIDFGIGLIPILGDIGDAFFRCNTRNAALLYNHLKVRGKTRLEGSEKSIGGDVHKQKERLPPRQQLLAEEQTVPSERMQPVQASRTGNPNTRLPQTQRFITSDDIISRPTPAKLGKQDSPKRGWLNHLISDNRGAKHGEVDVENGEGSSLPRVTR